MQVPQVRVRFLHANLGEGVDTLTFVDSWEGSGGLVLLVD